MRESGGRDGNTQTSTVIPLLRSSSDVSSAHERYQLSRFFSLASRSYFSSVRLSPVGGS